MPSRLFCAFFRVGATLAVAHRPNGAGYNTLGDRKGRPYALGNALHNTAAGNAILRILKLFFGIKHEIIFPERT